MTSVKIKNKSVVKIKPAVRPPSAAAIKNTLLAMPQSANRQGLVRKFTETLYVDFEAYGAEAIEACRKFTPDVYVRVIASLLPKEVKVETEASLTNAELEQAILRYISGDLAKVVSPTEGRPPALIEGKAEKGSEE